MRTTRIALYGFAALALVAWLSTAAHAQSDYRLVETSPPAAPPSDNRTGDEDSDLRARIAELEAQLRGESDPAPRPHRVAYVGYVYDPALAGGARCGPNGCIPPGGDNLPYDRCDSPSCGGAARHGACGCCASDYCDCAIPCCNPPCCNPSCCDPSGPWVEAEVTFFRYHRADGVRVGTGSAPAGGAPEGNDVEFDFEISPRVAIGYVLGNGRGLRARYWEYDHDAQTAVAPDEGLTVDTYTLDLELFDTFCLSDGWDLEVAFGIRYNEFDELMIEQRPFIARSNSFSGYGGLASLQLRCAMGCNIAAFTRVRGAILMDDKDVLNDVDNPEGTDNVRLFDSVQGMVELAIGCEYNRCLGNGAVFFARATAEWQNWFNYSSAFADIDDEEENFSGPADVGFGGFAFSVGIAR